MVGAFLILGVCALMGVLNRIRGGGFGADRLAGHPRFWVSGSLAVTLMPALGVWGGPMFGLAFLLWCWMPWGHLMCLGHWAPEKRPVSLLEAMCLDPFTPKGGEPDPAAYQAALALRHFIGLLPATVLVHWSAPLWAPFIALGYVAGWHFRPRNPIAFGEIWAGVCWGLLLVLAVLH